MRDNVDVVSAETAGEVIPFAAERRVYEVNGFRRSRSVIGTCEAISANSDSISLSGFVDGTKKVAFKLDHIVVVDRAQRLIATAPIRGNAWQVDIAVSAIGNDIAFADAAIYAVGPTDRILYQILEKAAFKEKFAQFAQSNVPQDAAVLPTFKNELRELITKAVATPYVSTSIHDSIKTGNSYQSLFLDDGHKTQGREDRERYLRMVALEGKSLIDIGSNMGEMSRLARYLGAKAVDGFEYDASFVEIGRAVNALNGTTGVSLYQADVTQRGFFKNRRYDAILALNVWVYIEKEFADFPAMAPLVLFETHTLDHGLKFYYDRVLGQYPFATCLSLSDFGRDPTKTRAFLALATNRSDLEEFVRQDFLQIRPYFPNRFIEKTGVLDQRAARQLASQCYGEVGSELPSSHEDFSFGSDRYFKTLLAGYHQYCREGDNLSADNIYVNYLKRGIEAGAIDPQLKRMAADDRLLLRKVANKFEDMEWIVSGAPSLVPPIQLYPDPKGSLAFVDKAGETITCRDIDGHHRFFMCELMGVKEIHFQRA